jgi:rhodanese-related sulfurtransferase
MLQLSRSELESWQKAGKKFRLVDVREEWEHTTHNIGGELIPLGDIMTSFLAQEFETPVVFYCKRGIRSQIAIQRLQHKYPSLVMYNLVGGIGQ